MKAQPNLSEGYALLLSLHNDPRYHFGADADHRRQAVLALPALIRAHGLAAVVKVCSARAAAADARAEQRMLAALLAALVTQVNGVAPDQAAFVARRTRQALLILDAAAALLDGVIPKPVAATAAEPAGAPIPPQEPAHA